MKGIIQRLYGYKEVEIPEGHMMPDHGHLLLSIPPKRSVSSFTGCLKGGSGYSKTVVRFCVHRFIRTPQRKMEKVWTKSESSVPFSQTFMSLQRSYHLYESAVKQLALKFEILNKRIQRFLWSQSHPPPTTTATGRCTRTSGCRFTSEICVCDKKAEIDRQMQDMYKRIKASEGEKK